jgi:hypothetical protein
MHRSSIGRWALCCALGGCVSNPPDVITAGAPVKAGASGAQLGKPLWLDDIHWSNFTAYGPLIAGDWDALPGPDVYAVGRADEVGRVLAGDGNGNFVDTKIERRDPLRALPGCVVSGDLNGDAHADLVYLSTLGSNDEPRKARITSLVRKADGFAVTTLDYAGGASALVLAELSGDAWLDLVVAYGGANNEPDATHLALFLGTGTGQFLARGELARIAGAHPLFVGVGDLRGQKGRDLLVVTAAGSRAQLVSLSLAAPAAQRSLALPGVPDAWVQGDVDGDGACDVVFARPAAQTYDIVLARDAPQLMRLDLSSDSYEYGKNVALGDLDADGQLDLIVPASDVRDNVNAGYGYGPALLVVFGAEAAFFPRKQAFQLSLVDEFGERVTVGDLDGDGRDDVLLSTMFGDQPEGRVAALLGRDLAGMTARASGGH